MSFPKEKERKKKYIGMMETIDEEYKITSNKQMKQLYILYV